MTIDKIKKIQEDIESVFNNKAFIVSEEKSKEFKNIKPNLESRQTQFEIISKLNIKNIADEGPVLKKTMRFGK